MNAADLAARGLEQGDLAWVEPVVPDGDARGLDASRPITRKPTG
jgi:hypothetical protein